MLSAGMIDQKSSHHLSGYPKEVCAVLQLRLRLIDEA
jgi:hypothetical protein